MKLEITLRGCDGILVLDLFHGDSGTIFTPLPKLFFGGEYELYRHYGIHWLGCCLCVEK